MLNIGQTFFSHASQALRWSIGWQRQGPAQQAPVPKDVLQKALFAALFAKGPGVLKDPALVSELAFGDMYVVGDYTSLYRTSEDFGLSLLAMYPNSSLSWMKDFFSSKDMITAYQTFGSLSGITFLAGLVKMSHVPSTIGYAEAIGDRRGALIGRISTLEGASMAGAGASSVGFRVLTIFDTIKDIKPESLLGRVCHGFSIASLVFWCIFFAVVSTMLGIQMYEGYQFQSKLKKAEDLAGQIEIIQKKMRVNAGGVYTKLVKKHGSESAANKVLIDEAYRVGKENLGKLLKELGIKDVPEERLKSMVHDILEEGVQDCSVESMQKRVQEQLMMIGLDMRVQKTQLKKQAKMGRILGSSGMDAMKEVSSAKSLAGRVRIGDPSAIQQANKLVDVIKKSTQRQITESAIIIGVLVLGIAAMVAAIALTGGTGILVSTALMLVFSITMLITDGYYLLQSYRGDRPAPHDKKMLAASAVMGVASLLAVSALGLSGVITLGTAPIVISFVLAAIWLAQNGATWAIINRNERRHNEKNPTLETLMKALDADKKEQVEIMFKNLSEIHRLMIDEEKKKHDGDLKEATRAVIRAVELTKKAHLEELRAMLQPHLVKSVAD